MVKRIRLIGFPQDKYPELYGGNYLCAAEQEELEKLLAENDQELRKAGQIKKVRKTSLTGRPRKEVKWPPQP